MKLIHSIIIFGAISCLTNTKEQRTVIPVKDGISLKQDEKVLKIDKLEYSYDMDIKVISFFVEFTSNYHPELKVCSKPSFQIL